MRDAKLLAAVLVVGCVHTKPSPVPVPSESGPGDCTADVDPAAAVLQDFRKNLWTSPTLFMSFPETVAAFTHQHQEILTGHARVRFLALPKLVVPDMEALPDDPRVSGEVAERMRQTIAGESKDDAGVSLALAALLPMDPVTRFSIVRAFVLGWTNPSPDKDRLRERIIEGFAAPRTVRLNDDPAHPILAMPKHVDLFVIWFDRKDDGYVPIRMRWLRREPPAEPSRSARTVDDVYLAFSLAMESVSVPRDASVGDISKQLSAAAEAMRKQWLKPHRVLLRRSGACAFKRLPLQPLPDLSAWHDEGTTWPANAFPLPSQVWDAEAAFSFVRTILEARSQRWTAMALNGFLDKVAPPTITRANADPDHPMLALIEGDTALIVSLRLVEDTGYVVESVRQARQGP